MRTFFVPLVMLMCSAVAVHPRAQSAAPSFEVVSIKPNKSGDAATELGFQRGGRFRAINETLWRLIGEAYATSSALPRFQMFGGPAWIDADRFDVEAVPEGSPDADQGHAMLRTLLADRFRLIVHRETRELPIYNLVRARANGSLGPQLHSSNVDCAARRAAAGTVPIPLSGQPGSCGVRFGRGRSSATGMTMPQLAEIALSRSVSRPVVDRTGLDGAFDWILEWTPDQQPPAGNEPVSIDPNHPSIFAAIQEQLGLKLEPARGPVAVLVIDRAEHPTGD